MFYIEIYADGQKLVNKTSAYLFVSGTRNLYGVRVLFSQLWDDIPTKYIQFTKEGTESRKIALDSDGCAGIPSVFTDSPGRICVSVYGGDLYTTTAVGITVVPSLYDAGSELVPEEPPAGEDYITSPSDDENISKLKMSGGVIYSWSGTEWVPIAANAYSKDESDERYIKNGEGTVSADNIASGAVTSDKIGSWAVTREKIEPAAVTSDRIADSAVVENKISDDAVTSDKIANYSVTEDKIANLCINSNKIAPGAVTTNKIADSAVIESKIGSWAVTREKIEPGAVTADRIADGVIPDSYTKTESDSRYIKDEAGSVSGSNIEAGAVTGAHIANDAVTEYKIAPDSVDFLRLQDNAVITNKILDGAVTTAKLDDDSVTTDKIANAAVTSLQIATGAVTINKILNNSVSEEKLSFDSVSTSKLQNLAVTTDKIADAAVTKEKISSDFLSEIDKKYANALIGEAVSSESSGGDYEPITLADANPVNLLNLYVLGYAYQASVPTPSNQSDIQFLSGTTTVSVNSQQAAQFTDIINYAFGKNYDFVDIVSGQGEKNIGRMEFDGTESWAAHSTPTIETADGGTGYVYRLSNADFGTAEASSPFAMCNYLRSNPKGTFSSSDAGTVLQNSVLGFASGGIIFVVTSFPTLDEWKAFLQQKAQSPAAKVYVIYKKAAPSSVSITPTEVAVNAGSVVSNSKNRRMYIRYNRDINSVIQQLTQAIAASAANI